MHKSRQDPRKRCLAALAVAALLAPFSSCAELAPIASDVCGNSVIDFDLGEECDGSVSAEVRAACEAASLAPDCNARCAQPGEVGACRYVASSEHDCPIGWARGQDDLCRRPSGKFEQLPFARVGGVALGGQIADFDGDGVSDLFLVGGDRPPSISYFDTSGSVVQTIDIPVANVSAGFISADRADDPAADLIVTNGPAITTFRGAEGKQLLQKAYAPFETPVPGAYLDHVPVVPANAVMGQVPPGYERPVARVQLENDVQYVEVAAATLELVSGATLNFPGLADQAIGPPVVADVLGDGSGLNPLPPGADPPLEIVEATASQIMIGRFPANGTPVQLIGAAADEQFLQLLPVAFGSTTRVAVRTLRGTTQFLRFIKPEVRFLQPPPPELAIDPEPPVLDPDVEYELPPGLASQPLLAVGYLNDDELPDIVTAAGVRFLVPQLGAAPKFTDAYASSFEPFEEAAITDLNHDGRREVVALGKTGDVVMLLPATPYTYNPVSIAIPDRGRNLVTGDFDGDGVDDLLVISGQSQGCDVEDELYLMFGNAAGMPDPPQLIGSLPGILRVLPIRFFFPFLPDGISDIAIQTRCASSGEPGDYVGVFFGNTSRIVSSPFSPYALEFTEDPAIERLTTGTLLAPDESEPDAHDDLAFVGSLQNDTDETFYDREIRLVTVTGDAQMADTGTRLRLVDGIDANIDDSRKLRDHVPAIATGQLFESSPADEIVVLSAYRTDVGPAKVKLFVAELEGGELSSAYESEIEADGIEAFSLSRIRLFDYDDDGDLDVVAFILKPAPSGLPTLVSALFVNDGATLSPASLDLSELIFVADFAELAPANCIGLSNCDDGRHIAVAGGGGVVTCKADSTVGCDPVHAKAAGTLLVGDLDSDGLEDLGVVDLDGFQAFRQLSQAEAQESREKQ